MKILISENALIRILEENKNWKSSYKNKFFFILIIGSVIAIILLIGDSEKESFGFYVVLLIVWFYLLFFNGIQWFFTTKFDKKLRLDQLNNESVYFYKNRPTPLKYVNFPEKNPLISCVDNLHKGLNYQNQVIFCNEIEIVDFEKHGKSRIAIIKTMHKDEYIRAEFNDVKNPLILDWLNEHIKEEGSIVMSGFLRMKNVNILTLSGIDYQKKSLN